LYQETNTANGNYLRGGREMPYVLGVDGGGSHTLAVIARMDGTLVGANSSGSTNLHASSPEGVRCELSACVFGAISAAGIEPHEIVAGCFGLAGAGRDEDRREYLRIGSQLGLRIEPVILTDAHIALEAAVLGGSGAVLISGTGSCCIARSAQCEIRSGGYGPILGDDGSGHAIALEALRACLRAHDGTGPSTLLTHMLTRELGIRSVSEIPLIIRKRFDPKSIAALCPVVFCAGYEHNDAVAGQILSRAADSLSLLALSVLQRAGTKLAVYLSGGLFFRSAEFVRDVRVRIEQCSSCEHVSLLAREPVAGAVWRALTDAGAECYRLDDYARRSSFEYRPNLADSRVTESANPLSEHFDALSAREIVELINSQDHLVAPAVRACLDEVSKAVCYAAHSLKQGARLIYVGAGTSGRLGVLDAAECPPTFGVDARSVVAVIAGGQEAIASSVEGAEDDVLAGANAMNSLAVCAEDTVVGIAASGNTAFTCAALLRAAQIGAKTVACVSNRDSELARIAQVVICPEVGPEVLRGSTRMKAATSHKMVLNMISTAAMALAGKVYSNFMVDLRPVNRKLRARAMRIVQEAGGVSAERAEELLKQANWRVKVAVLAALARSSVEEAETALERTAGFVRHALALLDCRHSGGAGRK